ncbi:MAG: hypothetical protein MUC87_07605 [Bacteroidia bacterium]|jgi:hypothetical protein|nr:hypothetical protein [Bacteroidia bacterium]
MNKSVKGIFIIILSAIGGYLGAALLLKLTTVQYTSFPERLTVIVNDERTGKDVTLTFPIRSGFPADSLQETLKGKTFQGQSLVTRELLIHQIPSFLWWAILICLMCGFAGGAFPYLIFVTQDIKRRFELNRNEKRLSILFAIFIAGMLAIANNMLEGMWRPQDVVDSLKIMLESGYVLTLIVGCTALLFFPGFILVMHIIQAGNKIDSKTYDKAKALQAFKHLHGTLLTVLQVMAILVIFSVLTSTALGQTLRDMVVIEGYPVYPPEVSYVYGLFFTFFLCILYIPAHLWIKNRYHQYLHNEVNADAEKEEKSLFDETIVNQIKVALTVLSPLITSFLPEHFHF